MKEMGRGGEEGAGFTFTQCIFITNNKLPFTIYLSINTLNDPMISHH